MTGFEALAFYDSETVLILKTFENMPGQPFLIDLEFRDVIPDKTNDP